VIIEGKRVILRDKRLADAANDYAWRTDPELARLDAAFPLKASFQDFLISYSDELRYSSPRRRRFAIDTLDGKHIGNCMYYDIDERRGEAELGIMIGDRDYWDKGYGADAIAALLRYLFMEAGFSRIYLNPLDWNIRAQKCFQKCGFVPLRRATREGYTFVTMEVRREWLEGGEGQGSPAEAEAKEEGGGEPPP